MKKSNNMSNPGSNTHGQKLTKKDIIKKQQAFNNKCVEYDSQELKDLKDMKDSGTIKGVYSEALDIIIERKEKDLLSKDKSK